MVHTVQTLPDEQMKFALNAAVDILPHNINIACACAFMLFSVYAHAHAEKQARLLCTKAINWYVHGGNGVRGTVNIGNCF